MPNKKAALEQIEALIRNKIETKLQDYASETEYSPFFDAVFGRETVVKASVMLSMYTSFGMSVYEQMAVILATNAGYTAQRQYTLLGSIDAATEALILELCRTEAASKAAEVDRIRKSIKPGSREKDDESCVDVFVKKPNGEELYIDITTVKPNLKEFRSLRRKMLRWAALRFSQNKSAAVRTCIGIPYNPYHPQPYERWTGQRTSKDEVLVQNDLWREFAGYDVFPDLLKVFAGVGEDMQKRIRSFLDRRR